MTAILHTAEEGGYWATCLEVPAANGQGETKSECLVDLRASIKFCLDTEREEALTADPNAELIELTA